MDRRFPPVRAARWIFTWAAVLSCAARPAVVVPGPPRPDFKPVADRVHALAVLVSARAFIAERTDDGRVQVHEAVSSASGVLIGNGLALTDLGAVSLPRRNGGLEPPSEIEVVIAGVGVVSARLVAGDAALGLAILRLPDEARALPGASLAIDPPGPGATMIAIGADDRSLTVIGVVLDGVVDGEDDSPRLRTDRALPASFRGGPLFDAQGRLAGVNVRRESDGSTAVPASLLRPLLEKLLGAGGT